MIHSNLAALMFKFVKPRDCFECEIITIFKHCPDFYSMSVLLWPDLSIIT